MMSGAIIVPPAIATPCCIPERKKRILRFVGPRGKKHNGVSSLEAEIEPSSTVRIYPMPIWMVPKASRMLSLNGPTATEEQRFPKV